MKNYSINYIASLFLLVSVTIFSWLHTDAQRITDKKSGNIQIPFNAANFDTAQRKVVFLNYKGFQSMEILPVSSRQTRPVTLKGINFTNGTIEFDARPIEGDSTDGIYVNFHQKDIYNLESVYLRVQPDESVQRNDAIQYTPVIGSVNLWDIMTPFRGYALIHNEDWNHFKLVISGAQMLVYVNSKDKPTLVISRLEGDYIEGSISFDGEALFANLTIKPGQTEGLSANPGFDLTDNDPAYIRKWMATYPRHLEKGKELTEADLPNDTVKWIPISVERRGLVNLYRKFPSEELTSYPINNRYVWLKTTIRSKVKQTVKLNLGFNKEVYIFVNRRLLSSAKNEAGELFAKDPGGRIAITNSTLEIPLNTGDNEIMIGIASRLYGWGIIAHLQTLNNLNIDNQTW